MKWKYIKDRETWICADNAAIYTITKARSGGYILARKGHQSFDFPFHKLKNAKLVAELIEEG